MTVGDFVAYSLKVENTSPGPFGDVMLHDRLPPGFAYQSGSTTIDGTGATDPEIASDGRTLEFHLGRLGSNSTSRVRYVSEAAAGVVPGPAVNTAVAADTSGITSNTASARVRVIEDPLTARSLIVGSVTGCDSCATCDSAGVGIEGVRILLEDGTYTLTDRRGMFHFQAVRPGVHVVQLDPASLPPVYTVVSCERNTRFAGRSYSRFVDLQGGTMWRADCHVAPKPRPTGEVALELASIIKGDVTEYLIRLSGSAVPVGNRRVQVMLPDGVTYVDGSSSLDGLAIDDPSAVSNVLTYRLGEAGAGWEQDLVFSGRVSRYSEPGELVTRALLTFDSPTQPDQRTPAAENAMRIEDTRSTAEHSFTMRPHFATLSAELGQEGRQELDEVIGRLGTSEVTQIEAEGHTDSRGIRERSRHLFEDNYALSLARARSVGDYLARGFGLDPSRVEAEGKGPDEPVASNETAQGRSLNRRVEALVTAKHSNGQRALEPAVSRDRVVAKTLGAISGEERLPVGEEVPAATAIPDYGETWLAAAEPGLEWLWPEVGFGPSIPSLKVVIKHEPGSRLVLSLNGEEVDPLNFDRTLESESGAVALSRWSGIDLDEGNNLFSLVIHGESGETHTMERMIHYSGPPVRADLIRGLSRLVANGMDPPVIAVRLADSYDYPARTGVVGAYSVDPPHLSLEELDE
ncbi:MAG: OmpA family protein, partial [Longimicrobiales bacterium]|nr:OmpA family protein [Longimicrobiales bacterium]